MQGEYRDTAGDAGRIKRYNRGYRENTEKQLGIQGEYRDRYSRRYMENTDINKDTARLKGRI